MKTIYIAGGKANSTAVNIMRTHLEGLGHKVTRDAQDPDGWDVTLRWGISYKGKKPALNAHVNEFDKFTCFKAFEDAGILCPLTLENTLANINDGLKVFPLPWLARKCQHTKGKDIVVCKTRKDLEQVLSDQTHDFFSVFIPTETEYRVWVCNGKALAVYEKEYKGEGEYDGYMRNRRFGFSFKKHDELRATKAITEPSIEAVKALDMDWGAVDILKGKDGKYYVLEVNSMPHIDKPARSSGIRLAAAVSKWAEGL